MISFHCGDSTEVLKQFSDNTFDSLVCDPPAAISLIGMHWDDNKGGRDQWIAWLTAIMQEVYRVLKPGSYGVVWALPRTSAYTHIALENAGFEVRDIIHHIFGGGYPTGKNIGKEFDRREGKGRKVKVLSGRATNSTMYRSFSSGDDAGTYIESLPEGELARKWYGWHTRLKPAAEHWLLVQKPIDVPSIADNVLRWGVGALNIEATRVPRDDGYQQIWDTPVSTNISRQGYILSTDGQHTIDISENKPSGGFTSNLVFSHHEDCKLEGNTSTVCHVDCPVALLDQQTGISVSKRSQRGSAKIFNDESHRKNKKWIGESTERGFQDSGGKSRFFTKFGYYAKVASSQKRFLCRTCDAVLMGSKSVRDTHLTHDIVEHPTPKNIELMDWLITLITPANGIVLDPFLGTGSTAVACKKLGINCIGIDMDREYIRIAQSRLEEIPD